MVKLVVRICAFFIVFAFILSWMQDCAGTKLDSFLDHLLSSQEKSKDGEITYDDIENADPIYFENYVNIKISLINQEYISTTENNVIIIHDINTTNRQINDCRQFVDMVNNYISNKKITQNQIFQWVEKTDNYKIELERQNPSLERKIADLKSEIESLKSQIKSLKEAIQANKTHFDRYRKKYPKAETEAEYEAIVEKLNNRIAELSDKISSLSSDLKDNTQKIIALQKDIEKLLKKLKNLSKQLNILIENKEPETQQDPTYYFIIDTETNLKDKGIITDGGLFGGIKVSSNLNTNEFGLLTDKNKTISLGNESDTFDILSKHSQGSFEFRKINGIKILVIKDVNEFWKESQYLVIVKQS